jgi:hypothetical protein
MINVQFPEPQFNIRKRGEERTIFDAIRKRWLVLTPEEWVRQNIVAYFTTTLQYPKEAIALEKEIVVNGLKKRFDVVVYDSNHQPWMLVECKAPQVYLNELVLQQALRYHLALPVQWIVITNGENTIGWEKKNATLSLIETLPLWGE